MTTTPYDIIAEFYDLENAGFTDDLPFWLALMREHGRLAGASLPVLELGCGTGRVTQQIARAGRAITGIDSSAAMLQHAQAKVAAQPRVAARITWQQAELTTFEVEAGFGLALLPYNTFMHLLIPTDQLAALGRVRAALKRGAVLAFDIANAGDTYASLTPGLTLERTFRDETRDLTIQQFAYQQLDRAAQRNDVLWQYDVIAADGSLRRVVVELAYRYTFPGEMALLLEKTGFQLQQLLGDYDFETPFVDGSPRMVVIAEAV